MQHNNNTYPWYYENKVVHSIADLPPGEHLGFVYKITNVTKGKIYIGRKNFYSVRRVKLGKKELSLLTDRRSSKYKVITKESNWLEYFGSNKDLLKDISSGDIIHKDILILCDSKAKITYYETKYQFVHEVIESDSSYNDNILGKFYSKIFEVEK